MSRSPRRKAIKRAKLRASQMRRGVYRWPWSFVVPTVPEHFMATFGDIDGAELFRRIASNYGPVEYSVTINDDGTFTHRTTWSDGTVTDGISVATERLIDGALRPEIATAAEPL
jgi:hypothetical protein